MSGIRGLFFFIEAIQRQTEILIHLLRRLKNIRQETEKKISNLKSQFSFQIVNFLFKRIKFTTTKFYRRNGNKPQYGTSFIKTNGKIGNY